MARILTLVISLSTWLFAGCGHRYYAVDYRFYYRSVLPRIEVSRLQPNDLAELAKTTTVAFAPASQCKDIVVGAAASNRVDLAFTDCGALMSELESAAQVAGFTVISWKALKEPVQQHAIERGVDLLIEVNRLALHDMKTSNFTVGEVQFFEDFPDAPRQRLRSGSLDEQVVARCINRAPSFSQNRIAAVLDVKVTAARSGKVLSRQIHMWPSTVASTLVMTEYYYGRKSDPPENVICARDSAVPDWHSDNKRANRHDREPGVVYRLINGESQPGGDPLQHLLQRCAKKFIDALVAVRVLYHGVTKARTEADDEGMTNGPEPGKPKVSKRLSRSKVKSASDGNEPSLEKKKQAAEIVTSCDQTKIDGDIADAKTPTDRERIEARLRECIKNVPWEFRYRRLFGKILSRNNKCSDAVPQFKRYLASADNDPVIPDDDKIEARTYLSDCEQQQQSIVAGAAM